MSTNEPIKLKEAFCDLVKQRLRDNPNCFFIGFDVSRHRLEVIDAADRICDMPIAEESILGIATGLSRAGCEVFVDLMFEAFVYRTMDVLVNQAALSALMSETKHAPIVVRMVCGPFEGAGPQHGGAGYAILARLPNILTASPSIAEDIVAVYTTAQTKRKPLLLLFGADTVVGSTTIEGQAGDSRVHRIGMGTRLIIVSWGLYGSIVQQAVSIAGASNVSRILIPLFISPLPTNTLLGMLGDAEQLLIIDGPPPPSTLGELFAANVSKKYPNLRITLHSLWENCIDAQYDREVCIRSLAEVICKLVSENSNLENQ